MKKYLLFVLIGALFFSCKEEKRVKRSFQSGSISTQIDKHLEAEVLLSESETADFCDLALTDDYYVFLTYYSDTMLYAYHKKDRLLRLAEISRTKKTFYEFPSFVKYNYRNKGKKNIVDIWDNDTKHIYHCHLDKDPRASSIPLASTPFSPGFIPSNSCSITKEELYGVAYSPPYPATFYSYNEKTAYYHVSPYPVIPGFDNQDTNITAYTSTLCVNEEKEVLVAALRYVNCVNFYDSNCDITHSSAFGETYIYPEKGIDASFYNTERSAKCFIDITCNDHYIYCLYDGSTDFTAQSTIVVFNWEGEHIMNMRADRNLRKIAVDAQGTCLLALAAGSQDTSAVIPCLYLF